MNYYPFHIGDYTSHTMHLEPLEDLAYRRMLDVYYTRDGALPLDAADVARLIRMRSNIDVVRAILEEFFEPVATGWLHARCEIELAKMLEKQDAQRERVNKRWDKVRSNRAVTTGDEHLNEAAHTTVQKTDTTVQKTDTNLIPPTPTPTPTPIKNTKNTSAIAPPDGVVESVWADFVDLRKSKKAKLTATAIDGIRAEADKAGWSLEAALRECCCRGWTGFKADWVAPKTKPGQPRQPQSFKAQDDAAGRARWEQMTGETHPDNLPRSTTNVIDITPQFIGLAQ